MAKNKKQGLREKIERILFPMQELYGMSATARELVGLFRKEFLELIEKDEETKATSSRNPIRVRNQLRAKLRRKVKYYGK